MKEIKFRGKRLDTGEMVYAPNLRQDAEYCGKPAIWLGDENGNYPCAVGSVVQLVGHDIDGKEIYEGDILTDLDGHKYMAALEARVWWEGTKVAKYWTLPFEQPRKHLDGDLALEFYNRVEKVRRSEKWLKKGDEDDGRFLDDTDCAELRDKLPADSAQQKDGARAGNAC